MAFAVLKAVKVMREQQRRRFVPLDRPSPSQLDRDLYLQEIPKREDGKLKMYVSGRKWYVEEELLNKYPNTLLGCAERDIHWSCQLGCFFFDRNKKAFKSILDFYKTGALNCPKAMEPALFQQELDFFRIRSKKQTNIGVEIIREVPVPYKDWPKWQRQIYYVVAEPGDNIKSKIWAILDTCFILCSIFLFVAETEPFFKERMQSKKSFWSQLFFWGDTACVIFFIFDFLIRFIVWPKKMDFLKSVMNWLDFLAILPFFFMIITEFVLDDSSLIAPTEAPTISSGASKSQFVALKGLRLMRVIRLLKLARHSDQLIMIVNVLRKSGNELSILVLLWLLGIVTFGSIIYYAESGDSESEFTSIMTAGLASKYSIVTCISVIKTEVALLFLAFLNCIANNLNFEFASL